MTDEFVERICRELYAERHKRDPELYRWATWEDFVVARTDDRVAEWREDVRLGIEVITRALENQS